jgi:outer membrane protein assembly factor BamE
MRYPTILLALFCVACGSYSTNIPSIKPYKMDIQQGNVITAKNLMQLRPGMSKSQVRFIMGTPLLEDSFHADRWDYFYQMRKGGKIIEQRRVTLEFSGDTLAHVRGDVIPAGSDISTMPATPQGGQPAPAAKAPPPKKEKGMLDSLKFWESDEKEPAQPQAQPKPAEAPKPEPASTPAEPPKAEPGQQMPAPAPQAPAVEPAPTEAPLPPQAGPETSPAVTGEPAPPAAKAAEPPREEPKPQAPAPEPIAAPLPAAEPTPAEAPLPPLKDESQPVKPEAKPMAPQEKPVQPAVKPAEPPKPAPKVESKPAAAAPAPKVEPQPAPAPKQEFKPDAEPKQPPKPVELPPEEAPDFFEKMLEKIGF